MARKKPRPSVTPSLYANPGTLLFYVDPYNAWRKMKSHGYHTLERYQKYLSRQTTRAGKYLSVRAQLSYILSVRGFFRFLSKERSLPFNPTANLNLPRVGKRLPRHVLTSEEVETVLGQPDISEPLGLRDRDMLEGGAAVS